MSWLGLAGGGGLHTELGAEERVVRSLPEASKSGVR